MSSEGPTETLLAWAAVGSRISGFHHDTASKMQSLMMALDEALELAGPERGDIAAPLETAMASLREMHALLTENRALAKAPQRKATALRDLVQRAAARSGVKLVGEVPATNVFVAPPSIGHALSLLLDLLAGPAQGPRRVELHTTATADSVDVVMTSTEAKATATEGVTIAEFLVRREGGAVTATEKGYRVQLPINARSAGDNA